MVRTQVQLTETQAQLLKQFAVQEDHSIAELIRQAIDLWLANKMKAPNLEEKRRRAQLVPSHFRSGLPDLAVNHDYYLAEAISGDPRDLKAITE
jgi:hypothetical protein